MIYGTCAGAIVLAKEATGKNAPETLNLIDITIDRNAYGSQVDSFETVIGVDMRNVETPHGRVFKNIQSGSNNKSGVSKKIQSVAVNIQPSVSANESRKTPQWGVSTGSTFIEIPVAFIRAPKITRVGKGVEVLAMHKGLPVLVRQGNVLVGTFHPEVRGESRIHQLFLYSF